MAYKHGIFIKETKQTSKETTESYSGVIVAIGTAPINKGILSNVNKPVIAYTLDDVKAQLGYSEDFENYTLSEVADVAFDLYQIAPVIFINVLDPEKHKTAVTNESIEVEKSTALIEDSGILLDKLVVKVTAEGQPLVKGTDYIAVFEDDYVRISALSGGQIPANATSLMVSYEKIDPSKVTEADVIGGYDITTGKRSGLEVVSSVFPILSIVPGTIIAPHYSKSSTVAAVMKAKAPVINSLFKAMYVADIDQETATTYTLAPAEKESLGTTDPFGIPTYGTPVKNGKRYAFSTHVAAVMAKTDSENKNLPYVSPSNKKLNIDSFEVNDNPVSLDVVEANYLNGQGIVTAINFAGGFKLWGSRTGAYPNAESTEDVFIPVRRMFNDIQNSIIIGYWKTVDDPMNKRLIESFVDDVNIEFNGLVTDGALLGGRLEFRPQDNPVSSLADGKIKFRIYLASPIPAEEIEIEMEFDVNYLSSIVA